MTTISPTRALTRDLITALRGANWPRYRRLMRPNTAQVVEIHCPRCHRWLPPRRFKATVAYCRSCTD